MSVVGYSRRRSRVKRALHFVCGGAVVLAASLVIPVTAVAQVRSWSYTFDPNDSTPSFQPPAPLPVITFAASYDNEAGARCPRGALTAAQTDGALVAA
jgi:hypothetical protein